MPSVIITIGDKELADIDEVCRQIRLQVGREVILAAVKEISERHFVS